VKIAFIGIAGDGTLATAFARGAQAIGHDAVVIDATKLVAGWRPLILARHVGLDGVASMSIVAALRRSLLAAAPDIVVVTKGRFLGRRGVATLRRAVGAPILNYYPDHPLWPGQTDRQILAALGAYDEILVWGAHIVEELQRHRVHRVRLIPFAYDPNVYTVPAEPLRRLWDVVFIGQCYQNRIPYAEALADVRLLVSGIGWARAARGGPLKRIVSNATLSARETCRSYWRSAMALNILGEWNPPAHNMRTFEIPASGTVMVATRTPEHVELLGEDGAVLVDSPQEARERVLQLLQEPVKLEGIARRGRERVAQHTYASRMEELLRPWVR
jgi:spore maturation protein CgeB